MLSRTRFILHSAAAVSTVAFLCMHLAACSQTVSPNSSDEDESSCPSVNASCSETNQNKADAAKRLEIPKLNEDLYFAPHWIDHNGLHIMNYAVEWNVELRHANWVAYSFDPVTSQTISGRSDEWKFDPEIPLTLGKVSESDHKKDGFDKGHLCTSADRSYSDAANAQTFYYSNISPQMSKFNGGFWETLEELVRGWGVSTQKGTYDTVYVAKGGTLNKLLKNYTGEVASNDGVYPKTNEKGLTASGLAVPAYYFMAVLARQGDTFESIAFCVPHSPDLPENPSTSEIRKYAISIDSLETFTGIDFFHNLPDSTEKNAEKTIGIEF